ncbi:hypothetical protein [Magnetospirillum sp. UT-4]|uniref:hypothetical protein n=1 Tax=Magnetospirillum sp. UT-4 TaxID=2681467 RepID=UPI00137F81CF|nr:hypothetical protein [Magnetospirillum sp. UT-4]CAA7611958.1 conserved hypothetical protein [Magnetospirillum sp. UT-4]
MVDPPRVSAARHPALGPMVRLDLGGTAHLLIPAEAATLGLALAAVADGRSAEREIFLSPLASDGVITLAVQADGLAFDGGGMDWAEVRALSAELRRLARC